MILIKNKTRIILLLLGLALLPACMKEEIAVPKHLSGDTQINEIEMGQDYRNQLYFDLGNNKVVQSNPKTAWDLAFESVGNHILLNTSKGMAIHKSTASFAAINSAEDLDDWSWDAHSGDLDSTAIGNWEANDFIYVIDRGYNWTGDHQGYYKLIIETVNAELYEISYAEISNNTSVHHAIIKSNTEQFTYFSFETGTVTIAPPDTEYDLIFTQYTHLFTDPTTPYVVTGILSNRAHTSIASLDEIPFAEIELQDVESFEFSYDIDAIGYDWKYYSFEDGIFTTDADRNYIIRTQTGLYYKFRIVGFYNTEGLKGYPNIEFQAL